MRSIWMKIATVCWVVFFGADVFAGDQLDAVALKIEAPPVLDGKLDEPFWKEAQPLGNFYIFKNSDKRRVNDTEFRLAYDDTWLYIGLKCDNPLQALVMDPKTKDHDGPLDIDETVEMFFDSAGDGKVYYHFMLSCFNIKAEQRVVDGQRQRESWNLPWRSATDITEKGWTAEVGIPLSVFVEYGNLENIRMNICRNRREPFMDTQNVITHENIHHSLWCPVIKSFHEPQSFGSLRPLTPGELREPFLASLERVEIKPYFTKDGENYYAVEVETRNANSQDGELQLVVIDQPAGDKSQVISKKIRQTGTMLTQHTMEIPAPSSAARDITIEIRACRAAMCFRRDILKIR